MESNPLSCLHRLSRWNLSVAMVLLIAGPVACGAGEAVFTLDPGRSFISLQGNVLGIALSEQGPGSLRTQFEGSIVTDLSESSVAFPGRGNIVARDNGNWQPAPGGGTGSAPANYGGKASSFLASAVAAARDIEFNLTSAALPLNAGQFDSRQVLFRFAEGGASTFDYRVTGLLAQDGQIALTGLTTNRVAGTSSIVTADGVQTLTIPVEATFVFTLLVENDGQLLLSGQLVATRTVSDSSQSYDDFASAFFPGITDPTVTGPLEDPDGDGLPNFVEFAFWQNPAVADTQFRPLTIRTEPAAPEVWLLEFVRPKGLTGIRYALEASTDLRNWAELTTAPETTDLGDGRERVRLSVPQTADIAGRYVRLTVHRL